jgi:hypothetical protein
VLYGHSTLLLSHGVQASWIPLLIVFPLNVLRSTYIQVVLLYRLSYELRNAGNRSVLYKKCKCGLQIYKFSSPLRKRYFEQNTILVLVSVVRVLPKSFYTGTSIKYGGSNLTYKVPNFVQKRFGNILYKYEVRTNSVQVPRQYLSCTAVYTVQVVLYSTSTLQYLYIVLSQLKERKVLHETNTCRK